MREMNFNEVFQEPFTACFGPGLVNDSEIRVEHVDEEGVLTCYFEPNRQVLGLRFYESKSSIKMKQAKEVASEFVASIRYLLDITHFFFTICGLVVFIKTNNTGRLQQCDWKLLNGLIRNVLKELGFSFGPFSLSPLVFT